MKPQPLASEEQTRRRLRTLAGHLREYGFIGGPDCVAAAYRAERFLRTDRFLEKVAEQRQQRLDRENR